MKAGRELDALVAEKVMGLKVVPIVYGAEGWGYEVEDSTGTIDPCPEYSTDIGAAFTVLEYLRGDESFSYMVSVETSGTAHVQICDRRGVEFGSAFSSEHTVAHAICTAALRLNASPR